MTAGLLDYDQDTPFHLVLDSLGLPYDEMRVALGQGGEALVYELELDGVSVTVNGKPAFVYFISPTQININTPEDTTTGPVAIQVKTPLGLSNAVTVNRTRISPTLLTKSGWTFSGLSSSAPCGRWKPSDPVVRHSMPTTTACGMPMSTSSARVPAGDIRSAMCRPGLIASACSMRDVGT